MSKIKYIKHFLVLAFLVMGMLVNMQNINANTSMGEDNCQMNSAGYSCLPVHNTEYRLCHEGGTYCGTCDNSEEDDCEQEG